MKLSIATVTLSGDLEEKLAAVARAGFDGVEIFDSDFLASDRSPREVAAMVRDSGLEVTALQPFRDFEGLPPLLRQKALDRAERKFDVMGELGAPLLLVCSSISPDAEGGLDRAADDFRLLGERAARRGLRIGYEALAWGRFIADHRDAWEVVRRAGHPNVGLILDSFHTLARGIGLESIAAIPKEKLFLVQLADAPRLDRDLLSWSRHFRCMPGQGDLPVVEFMRAVRATGYDGTISLEIFSDQTRTESPRAVAVDGMRSLVHLLDRVPGARPPLPPRTPTGGVAFIEFAVDEESAANLALALGALDFVRTAASRSRDAVLWRQGDVDVVLNAEREGFAHSFFIAHGPSVCAIGLRVPDPDSAIQRAVALRAVPFGRNADPAAPAAPAIRAIGGSLLYFVGSAAGRDAPWRDGFVFESPGLRAPARPVAVDHVSETVNAEELLSWLLFFKAIVDVEAPRPVDVADLAGLVRSQVVQNREGSFRLVLNGPQSARTLSGRFIGDFFGSGVQHVAFATDDIFALAARLAAAGDPDARTPANYYADLAARLDLAPDFVARLEAHSILYDRDAGGDYLQLYTTDLTPGFFFEVVQRNGYAGLGAANAPIRLAAQGRRARHLALVER